MAVTAVVFDVDETLVSSLQNGDLYPDALECLVELRSLGYAIGLAGNQPSAVEAALHERGIDVDVVVDKSSPEFFERLLAEAGRPAHEIAYVAGRLDEELLPAKDAGLRAVFLRRGPRAYLHALLPEAADADARIDSLSELPDALTHV